MRRSNSTASHTSVSTAIFLLALTGSAHTQEIATEALTNEAIVQMVAGKLPRELILTKVQTATPGFDLTAPGLIFLTQNQVSEPVLKAMLVRVAAVPGAATAAQTETLTNADVIAMVTARVPKPVVLMKIQRTRAAFDLSAAGLVSLNENKVPKDLIKAMMLPPTPPPARNK